MRIRRLLLSVLALLFLPLAAPTSAQVVTGTPPFGSFSGGPDIVDNANLNVDYTIPVSPKAGRGMNFGYNIGYDSSVWQPAPSGSTGAWQPVPGWGWWSGLAAGGQQYILYAVASTGRQICNGQDEYNEFTFTNFVYYDIVGTPHYFNTSATYVELIGGEWVAGCPPLGASYPSGQTTSIDGFTMTYSVSAYTASLVSLVYRNGSQYAVPIGTIPPGSSGNMSVTDRNGNVLSSSNGTYTDTLGQTALTVANGTTTTLAYTAPSGATADYTISYVTKTVKTNFGCTGVAEFGPTSESLVNEVTLPDGSSYQFTYEATPGFSGDVTGRVASVKLPTGGTISYTYTGSNNGIECADGSTAGLQRSTPDTGSNYWAYSRTLGTGGGPNTTTITDPQGNQTVLDFQGIYETERDAKQLVSGSQTLLKNTYTCYNANTTPPCNSTAVTAPITKRSVTISWPNGSNQQARTVTTYNSMGLVTETDEYPYGPGAPGSTIARKTLTSYAGLGNGILDMPASVTVEDGSNNVAAQTTYCYDEATPSRSTTCGTTGPPTATSGTPQHVSITGSRGNATTINHLVSGSNYLSSGITYYDTGNVNVATDVNGGTTTPSYSSTGSCGNSFPTSVTEAVSGLSRSMTWNCNGGVLLTSVDENNQTTTIAYSDPYYWRPASATDPTSATAYYSYTPSPQYPTVFSTAGSLEFNGNDSIAYHQNYLDSLGRVYVNQVLQAPGGSSLDTVSQTFDSDGRLHSVSMPCSTGFSQTCSTPQKIFTYDTLGRKTVVSDNESPALNLTFTYNQNDTYRSLGPAPTGEDTKDRQYEYDALGRLTSVCEITTTLSGYGTCGQTNSKSGYWTQYTYDLLNDLKQVTQNAQSSTTQVRKYTYDDLGRILSEQNPESGSTATQYTYDTDSTCGTSKGDLVKKVDQTDTICYSYDALHRLTSVTYPSGGYSSTPSRYFVYDSATVNSVTMANAKARMAEAYTCTGSCTSKITDIGLSYTVRGEVSDGYESTPHSGGYNHSSATYWANGVLDTLSGAGGYATNYAPDGEGRVYSAGTSGGELKSTTYNAASQPLVVTFGSGDSDTFSYDPNTGRMKGYTFTVNSQSATGTLTWNPIGTLEKLVITDPFNSANAQTCSYTHDDLLRIASDSCTGSVGWSQTMTYDAFGNLSKSGSQSFLPTYSSTTNRMTTIGSNTPTYDANGNVTTDFLNTYAWDANGRPTTVNGVTVTYDALGRIAELTNGSTNTEIQYSPTGFKMQLLNGSTLVKGFVPMPGGTAEVWTGSGANYYRHSDWLGSSRLASNFNRTIYYDGAYGPFGEQYANTGTTDLSFTGMNQDISSNVYDFPAREYGIQGRWPSPDPAGLAAVDPSDPQSWDRYAYVRNSPLNLIDPLGLVHITTDGWVVGDTDGDSMCNDAGCQVWNADGGYWELSGPVIISETDLPDPGTGGPGPSMPSGNSGGTPGGSPGDSGTPNRPPKPKTCTAAQQQAATLANLLENVSTETGWLAFGSGLGTALSAAGEGITFGTDTPATITFGSMTAFFGTASFGTGAVAAALNSFASGDMAATRDFNSSQVTNLIFSAGASKIPGISRWAETIGDLAEQVADLGATAKEVCQVQ